MRTKLREENYMLRMVKYADMNLFFYKIFSLNEERWKFHLKKNLLKVWSHDNGRPTLGDGLGDELLA